MKWKPFLLCHLVIGCLVGSFLWPVTRHFWDLVDVAVFRWCNGGLEGVSWAQHFWAFANHKKADLVEDGIFLIFFAVAVYQAPCKFLRTAQLIFMTCVAALCIYFVNTLLIRNHALFPRKSPSLVVTPCIRVSQEIPWLSIKDATETSFPGDHATTLLFFAPLYTLFAGRRLGVFAWGYTLFRLMPRVVLGAHWCSDIAVGTTTMVVLIIAWTVYTPCYPFITGKIERLLRQYAQAAQKKTLGNSP